MFKLLLPFLLVIGVVISGCSDPKLWTTPLPNGYSFNSNGGEFGYVQYKGDRLSTYFGMLVNGEEKWCTDFAWNRKYFVCKYIQYGNGIDPKDIEYFVLNTDSGRVLIFSTVEDTRVFWKKMAENELPELKRKHPGTVSL